jgi:diguanylate cyclase (GGDEF)-like protein
MRKESGRKRALVKPSAALARPASAAVGERSPGIEPREPPRRPARSAAMQLAAEVERLEFELAAAHSRMAALEARAEIDPLTELVNRRGFERECRRALAYVKRYGARAALVFFDLDGFKLINDRHGHAAGDAVLKAVAMVLARQVRTSDLVARIGGDEFVVLLWHVTEEDALAKAHVLEAAVARMTSPQGGVTLSIGASAGVAMLLPLDTPASVLERADRAMYARKSARAGAAAARA